MWLELEKPVVVFDGDVSVERRILDKMLYVVVPCLVCNTISVIPVLVTKLWALTGIHVLHVECIVKISFDVV